MSSENKKMTVGERIKARRIELGYTQLEVAKKMGYKNKSAICNVEKNGDNITSDRIAKFAEVLDCTPTYLMGWEVPEPSVEYSSTFKDCSRKVDTNCIILDRFKADIEQLGIEDLKTVRALIEKQIDSYYENIK